jgi:hypothetical protein
VTQYQRFRELIQHVKGEGEENEEFHREDARGTTDA